MEKTGLFRQTFGTLRKNYVSLLPVALVMELLVLLPQLLNLALGRWGGLESYLYQVLETVPTPPLWVAAGAGMLLGELRFFLLFCLQLGLLCLCLDKILGRTSTGGLAFCFRGKKRLLKCLGIYALCYILPGLIHRLIRLWVLNGLNAKAVNDYIVAMSDVNLVMAIAFRLFFSLLLLAVAFCFLSRPEDGFWRAVGRGIAEGTRRWPKCIGFWLCIIVSAQMFRMLLFLPLIGALGGAATWVVAAIGDALLIPYFYLAAAQLASGRFRLKADTEKEYDYGTIQD